LPTILFNIILTTYLHRSIFPKEISQVETKEFKRLLGLITATQMRVPVDRAQSVTLSKRREVQGKVWTDLISQFTVSRGRFVYSATQYEGGRQSI